MIHQHTESKDFVQCETHSKQGGHSSQINTIVRESADGFKSALLNEPLQLMLNSPFAVNTRLIQHHNHDDETPSESYASSSDSTVSEEPRAPPVTL